MDDRYIEIEPYEEIVDRAEVFSTPSGSRSASPVSVDRSLPPAQSLSQGPSTSVYNANTMTSVMRPDPRYELALASQVPHTQTEHPDTSAVAVTQLVRSLIWSTALYGSESWALKKCDEKLLTAFEMWVWRRMLKISRTERKANTWMAEDWYTRKKGIL